MQRPAHSDGVAFRIDIIVIEESVVVIAAVTIADFAALKVIDDAFPLGPDSIVDRIVADFILKPVIAGFRIGIEAPSCEAEMFIPVRLLGIVPADTVCSRRGIIVILFGLPVAAAVPVPAAAVGVICHGNGYAPAGIEIILLTGFEHDGIAVLHRYGFILIIQAVPVVKAPAVVIIGLLPADIEGMTGLFPMILVINLFAVVSPVIAALGMEGHNRQFGPRSAQRKALAAFGNSDGADSFRDSNRNGVCLVGHSDPHSLPGFENRRACISDEGIACKLIRSAAIRHPFVDCILAFRRIAFDTFPFILVPVFVIPAPAADAAVLIIHVEFFCPVGIINVFFVQAHHNRIGSGIAFFIVPACKLITLRMIRLILSDIVDVAFLIPVQLGCYLLAVVPPPAAVGFISHGRHGFPVRNKRNVMLQILYLTVLDLIAQVRRFLAQNPAG